MRETVLSILFLPAAENPPDHKIALVVENGVVSRVVSRGV